MIRYTKGPIPEILQQNARDWTVELLALIEGGREVESGILRRYAHSSIKSQVKQDSYDKCIYCESKITHISYGDIDHIKPKSRFPAETYSWDNLALVCNKCNNTKRDNYDPATPPINPYRENPALFLKAVGAIIWPEPGNDRGQVTVSIVKLNRTELLERRRARLEQIRPMFENIARAINPEIRAIFREQLLEELKPEKEYVFVCKTAIETLGFLGNP